ncbi:MAG: dependent ligase [Paenibacillus sp.]|jgi:DNA ligase-1|nr:dependent ligase [Paenibacillus sp.]
MLLETANYPFTHPDFLYEPKIDGHRLNLSRTNGDTHLYTRHNNNCTRQYPELYDLNEDDISLDGEVACTDRVSGAIDFESVMERFSAKRSDKILRLVATQPANYIVFDILRYRGIDLHGWPLIKRKELLASIDFGNPRISVVPYIEREGERLYQEIVARKMEGIVAKRRESVYSVGQRSGSWLKLINWTYVDVVLTGWRKDEFGWLCAVQREGRMQPAGVIELGVTPIQKKALHGIVEPLITSEDKANVYIKPMIRARVKIRNWTRKGLLRSPVFVAFNV